MRIQVKKDVDLPVKVVVRQDTANRNVRISNRSPELDDRLANFLIEQHPDKFERYTVPSKVVEIGDSEDA